MNLSGTLPSSKVPRNLAIGTITGAPVLNTGLPIRFNDPATGASIFQTGGGMLVIDSGSLAGVNRYKLSIRTNAIERLAIPSSNAGSAQGKSLIVSREPFQAGTFIGKSSAGSLNRGTMANARLPRNITVGTMSGLYHAGSLNRGTLSHARYYQSLGSHLAGSVATAPTVRYGVWSVPFADNSYVVSMSAQFRATGSGQGPDNFRYGLLSKKAGSVRYFVKTQAGLAGVGTIPPVGTLTLVGFAS